VVIAISTEAEKSLSDSVYGTLLAISPVMLAMEASLLLLHF
jgi:hypothetical protein